MAGHHQSLNLRRGAGAWPVPQRVTPIFPPGANPLARFRMSRELEGKPDMASAARRMTALIGLTAAALDVAACSGTGHPAKANGAAAVSMVPQRILRAPGSLLSATQPQPNGSMWMLAGVSSRGLFEMDSSTGRLTGSVSVSGAARSVAETSTGVIGLALGTARSG